MMRQEYASLSLCSQRVCPSALTMGGPCTTGPIADMLSLKLAGEALVFRNSDYPIVYLGMFSYK